MNNIKIALQMCKLRTNTPKARKNDVTQQIQYKQIIEIQDFFMWFVHVELIKCFIVVHSGKMQFEYLSLSLNVCMLFFLVQCCNHLHSKQFPSHFQWLHILYVSHFLVLLLKYCIELLWAHSRKKGWTKDRVVYALGFRSDTTVWIVKQHRQQQNICESICIAARAQIRKR